MELEVAIFDDNNTELAKESLDESIFKSRLLSVKSSTGVKVPTVVAKTNRNLTKNMPADSQFVSALPQAKELELILKRNFNDYVVRVAPTANTNHALFYVPPQDLYQTLRISLGASKKSNCNLAGLGTKVAELTRDEFENNGLEVNFSTYKTSDSYYQARYMVVDSEGKQFDVNSNYFSNIAGGLDIKNNKKINQTSGTLKLDELIRDNYDLDTVLADKGEYAINFLFAKQNEQIPLNLNDNFTGIQEPVLCQATIIDEVPEADIIIEGLGATDSEVKQINKNTAHDVITRTEDPERSIAGVKLYYERYTYDGENTLSKVLDQGRKLIDSRVTNYGQTKARIVNLQNIVSQLTTGTSPANKYLYKFIAELIYTDDNGDKQTKDEHRYFSLIDFEEPEIIFGADGTLGNSGYNNVYFQSPYSTFSFNPNEDKLTIKDWDDNFDINKLNISLVNYETRETVMEDLISNVKQNNKDYEVSLQGSMPFDSLEKVTFYEVLINYDDEIDFSQKATIYVTDNPVIELDGDDELELDKGTNKTKGDYNVKVVSKVNGNSSPAFERKIGFKFTSYDENDKEIEKYVSSSQGFTSDLNFEQNFKVDSGSSRNSSGIQTLNIALPIAEVILLAAGYAVFKAVVSNPNSNNNDDLEGYFEALQQSDDPSIRAFSDFIAYSKAQFDQTLMRIGVYDGNVKVDFKLSDSKYEHVITDDQTQNLELLVSRKGDYTVKIVSLLTGKTIVDETITVDDNSQAVRNDHLYVDELNNLIGKDKAYELSISLPGSLIGAADDLDIFPIDIQYEKDGNKEKVKVKADATFITKVEQDAEKYPCVIREMLKISNGNRTKAGLNFGRWILTGFGVWLLAWKPIGLNLKYTLNVKKSIIDDFLRILPKTESSFGYCKDLAVNIMNKETPAADSYGSVMRLYEAKDGIGANGNDRVWFLNYKNFIHILEDHAYDSLPKNKKNESAFTKDYTVNFLDEILNITKEYRNKKAEHYRGNKYFMKKNYGYPIGYDKENGSSINSVRLDLDIVPREGGIPVIKTFYPN
jgi:hypothetical protein